MDYRHILLAVDLDGDNEVLAQRAADIAGRYRARLSLIHVVEHFPVDPAGESMIPAPVNMEEELVSGAREKLTVLARSIKVEAQDTHVRVGVIRQEIGQLAEQAGVDLIVIGRHQRHGLALLLGSTEGSVLRAAPCDVLAVNLP